MKKTIPAIPVHNIATAVSFYQDKLGFVNAYADDDFARLTRDEVEIHLWAAADESWKHRGELFSSKPISSGAESFLSGTVSCRIEVVGIDELFSEYKASGVLYSTKTKVEPQPWGTREFPALDLHGNLLTFYERVNA